MSSNTTRKWMPAGRRSRDTTVRSINNMRKAPINRIFHRVGETVTWAIVRRIKRLPPARSSEMMRMIAVGSASQSGTLCASTSPLNARRFSLKPAATMNYCRKKLNHYSLTILPRAWSETLPFTKRRACCRRRRNLSLPIESDATKSLDHSERAAWVESTLAWMTSCIVRWR